MSIHPLALPFFAPDKLVELPFVGPEALGEEGWYIWRLNPKWSIVNYRVVEICGEGSVMVDQEPADNYGIEWRVVDVKPYGQFFGPILER